ncbi:multidomain presynaptic cytomatrix related protein [Aspergillus affinis]|uniref:multidomain presynaptic cytomatrix related protein n=1 Tax=Aspergillus affinis TaxID=1070780 RepID=UPI0022FDBDF8|nr:uncharacterized protein KD926_000863 [Aspergillus affinis]KAI9037077.1 hypothetical protein KD926_000863 [Aspergillus affinis]
MTSLNKSGDTQFTVFIRLPFPRGEFVDPPPVEWNAAKDQALWDLLSRPSKGDDIDWKALAESFDVTLQFLLQQAAWLYDRQLAQVRAQMRKVPNTQSNSPSPAPGSVSGSTALGNPPASKGAPTISTGSRPPNRLTLQQKDNVPPRGIASRRTSSTTTVNQIKGPRESPRNETPASEPKDPRRESFSRRPSTSRRDQTPNIPVHRSPTLEEEDLTSSSSESESDDGRIMASRRGPRFRFGKFSMHRAELRDEDEDEDESPAFVPLSPERESAPRDPSAQDLNATLRDEPTDPRRRMVNPNQVARQPITMESSASSISSGNPATLPAGDRRRRANQMRTELGYSSRRSVTSGREASDGTPSMGSSFSDLDDASVTQSALEEALMSNMQHGGMASRMSTISQALRSRYLRGITWVSAVPKAVSSSPVPLGFFWGGGGHAESLDSSLILNNSTDSLLSSL